METVFRAVAVYFIVFVLLRLAGRRTLAEITTFDFVLLLIIGEATQQALLGDDFSVTNAAVIITTLVIIDIGLSYVKRGFPRFAVAMDGQPMIVVMEGRPLRDRMKKARIDDGDILEAARQNQGIYRMEEIKYAIVEVGGAISIIPKDETGP